MSKSKTKPAKPTSGIGNSASPQKHQEEQLLDKIPDQTTPAQEWGERYKTGEAIAKGGQVKHGSSPQPAEEDRTTAAPDE